MIKRITLKQAIRALVLKAITSPEGKSELAETLLLYWHTAFMAKAHGGADEFGNEWEPLAPSTIARKRNSPWQGVDRRRQWNQRQQQLVSQLVGSGMSRSDATAKALALAWQDQPAAGESINIDSTTLEASLDPSGHPDQVRDIGGKVMTIGSGVEYAKYVNRRRRFKPTKAEARAWLKRGVARIRDQVAKETKERFQ